MFRVFLKVVQVALGEMSGLLVDTSGECFSWGFMMGLNVDNHAPFPQPSPRRVAADVSSVFSSLNKNLYFFVDGDSVNATFFVGF